MSLGYNFGIDGSFFNSVDIHTVHGIRVGKYFSVGLGVGFDLMDQVLYSPKGSKKSIYAMMPVYVDVRGYLPVSAKTNLFLSLDAGVVFNLGQYFGPSAIYIRPELGASFRVAAHKAINLGVGYKTYIGGMGPGGVSVRLAFQF